MKNKTFTCISMLILFLVMTGCSKSVAKLAVDTEETTVIDATAKINPYDYLEDVAEDANVEYVVNDNIMTITVSKNDKTETFEIPVEIEEPNVFIDEDITIDTYAGYDIEEFIHEDEGVTHITNFNEETGDLSVTFTKGEWTTTLDSQVEVTDSDPVNKWPKKYSCYVTPLDDYFSITLYEDGTYYSETEGHTANGVWTYDGNGNFTTADIGYATLPGKGDYRQFVVDWGLNPLGNRILETCTFVE